MKIGYARTSTADQIAGLEAQLRDLEQAGCERVYSEHISAATRDRPKMAEMLSFAREGDVIVVMKPDRLARSTIDLLQLVDDLNRRKIGLIIKSLGGEELDTSKPTSKLLLTVLAGIATWEREIMRERQAEGIAKAQREGKYKGRQASIDVQRITEMQAAGIGATEIARQLGISRASVYRLTAAE